MDSDAVLKKLIEYGLSSRTKWIDKQTKAIRSGDLAQQIICSMNIARVEYIMNRATLLYSAKESKLCQQ